MRYIKKTETRIKHDKVRKVAVEEKREILKRLSGLTTYSEEFLPLVKRYVTVSNQLQIYDEMMGYNDGGIEY